MSLVPVAASSKRVKQFTAWSFSRYNAYRRCPLAAKLSLLDKLPQEPSSAMARGEDIHNEVSGYISGTIAKMPESTALFKDLVNDLRAKFTDVVEVEDTWAFRRDWSVTRYDDWAGCWLRIKTDAVRLNGAHLDVLDWKTGKYSPQWNTMEYELQVDLYSLGALIMFGDAIPNITVTPYLVYLDHGVVHPEVPKTYTMRDLPRLKQEWENRVRPMLNDQTFARTQVFNVNGVHIQRIKVDHASIR